MDTEHVCPYCNQQMSVDSSTAGRQADCSRCGKPFTVQAKTQAVPAVQEPELRELVFCPRCGSQNHGNNFKCVGCGFALHESSHPRYVVIDDNTMGGLFPYKNQRALWAYYLGIFSLIPCLGFPLGVAALVLGIGGLKYAELHPETKGKGHSWTGIILGGLCIAGWVIFAAVMLVRGVPK